MQRTIERLSTAEQAKAARFRRSEDAIWWGYVRYALHTILGQYIHSQRIEFELGENGKPYLNANLHPELYFNLSHTQGLALLAINTGAEVGVDVEAVKPMDDMHLVAKHFFSPREQLVLKETSSAQQCSRFMQFWTRKEAVLKCSGEGLSDSLPQLDVIDINGNAWQSIAFKGLRQRYKLALTDLNLTGKCPQLSEFKAALSLNIDRAERLPSPNLLNYSDLGFH